MTDSMFRETGFAGSPILSFGEAPVKRRVTKLLAVLAGSFVACLFLLSGVFWFISSTVLPAEMTVLAIVPAGMSLPEKTPGVWRTAQSANRPLPTALGFAKTSSGKTEPFALRVFSLVDLFQGDFSLWKLESGEGLATQSGLSPWQVFGTPFGADLRLSLWPKRLIGSRSDELPEVLTGVYTKHIWKIKNTDGSLALLQPVTSTSAIALDPSLSHLLTNFAASNGFQIQFPSAGKLGWDAERDNLGLTVTPETARGMINPGLLQGYDIFDKKSALLQDDTSFQILNPPESLSATSTLNGLGQFIFNIPVLETFGEANQSVRSLACPGEPVAFFNDVSLKNICSWIDICHEVPKQLLVTKEGDDVNFCLE